MRSLRNFKNRLVVDKQNQALDQDTRRKIIQINDSSYKLETKKFTSSALKADHSIEKKSPIHIPQQFTKKKKQPEQELTFRQQISAKYKEQSPHPIKEFPVYSQRTPSQQNSIYDILNIKKSNQGPKSTQNSLNNEQLECVKEMWRSIEKLKKKQPISKYVDQMKTILNQICKEGLKPQFSFQQQSSSSVKKSSNIPTLIHKTAIESSPYSPSNQKQQSIQQKCQISPKALFSEKTQDQNIQYRKIMYMLDRNSHPELIMSDTDESSLFQTRQPQTFRTPNFLLQPKISSRQEIKKSDKRAVLNSIVTMLNTKYHRNIKL